MLFFTLAGCSGAPSRAPPVVIDDPALTQALGGLLCRVEPECEQLRLQVLDRPFEQAEMFPDGRLLVNIGLLLATHDEAEVAFVLAHETAHRRLRHRIGISPTARTRLELEADADAVRALLEADLRADAGLFLLERLLLKANEARSRGSRVAGSEQAKAREFSRVKLQEEALTQIQARVDALRALAANSASDRLPVTADWQHLLAPYRISGDQPKADGPASPLPQNPPSDL